MLPKRHVLIISPSKTAMQSGKGKEGQWKIKFLPESPKMIDPLMGWTGSDDTMLQLDLSFPYKESAIEYANQYGYTYTVKEPQKPKRIIKSYSDNFTRKPKSE